MKFIVTFIAIFFLMILILGARTIARIIGFFFGRRSPSSYYNNQPQKEAQPETQEERIISYRKKEFEATQAEDVEFEEIKDKP